MGNSSSSRASASAAASPPRSGSQRASTNSQRETQQQGEQDATLWQSMKSGYQELVNAIIRPPRAEYTIEELGPETFPWANAVCTRDDFDVPAPRGGVLKCSKWEVIRDDENEKRPCLIYLHGNSSARLEAIPHLDLCLSLGISMVAFDFAGSGMSSGDYVSLGYYERDDLQAVIEYLRKSNKISMIALWGRSMGAATALLHGDRDQTIAAMILDSAFSDLTVLAEEMVEKGREAGLNVPGLVIRTVMGFIRRSVQRTAGFNIRDLCPIGHADRTFIPALFVAAVGDDFIAKHHSEDICRAYAGDKNLVLVEGDHNSPRPGFLNVSIAIFLRMYLQLPPTAYGGIDEAAFGVGAIGGIGGGLAAPAAFGGGVGGIDYDGGPPSVERPWTPDWHSQGGDDAQQRRAPPVVQPGGLAAGQGAAEAAVMSAFGGAQSRGGGGCGGAGGSYRNGRGQPAGASGAASAAPPAGVAALLPMPPQDRLWSEDSDTVHPAGSVAADATAAAAAAAAATAAAAAAAAAGSSADDPLPQAPPGNGRQWSDGDDVVHPASFPYRMGTNGPALGNRRVGDNGEADLMYLQDDEFFDDASGSWRDSAGSAGGARFSSREGSGARRASSSREEDLLALAMWGEWQCPQCTLENEATARYCAACAARRPNVQQVPPQQQPLPPLQQRQEEPQRPEQPQRGGETPNGT